MKTYATKEELRRKRRLEREAKQQEIRDKIAMGLMPPPPPKVRLSNLMRVLGEQHAADPSQVEARVRAEAELRVRVHEASNVARMLTPEERDAKRQRRLASDAAQGLVGAVFRVSNLIAPLDLAEKRRNRMAATAKALGLGGRVLVVAHAASPSLVFVEGGPRSVRKFARLVLRTMDWRARTLVESLAGVRGSDSASASETSDSDSDSASDEDADVDMDGAQDAAPPPGGRDGRSRCWLVWRGPITSRAFEPPMRIEFADSALDARAVLAPRGVAHYLSLIHI